MQHRWAIKDAQNCKGVEWEKPDLEDEGESCTHCCEKVVSLILVPWMPRTRQTPVTDTKYSEQPMGRICKLLQTVINEAMPGPLSY